MDERSSLSQPTNGHTPAELLSSTQDQQDLSQVVQALEAIYNPRSPNEVRQAASSYVENARRHPQAPNTGYRLALDRSKPATLRHYGLSMLEFAIKYRWEDFSEAETDQLRQYVVDLAQSVSESDPSFLRNKIAQLWTEIAKRAWAVTWMDMDELLVKLWTTSMAHQGIVLYILETLSEEIFSREDPTAGLRGNELGQACVEIFTPAVVLRDHFASRDTSINVRYGDEGWLERLCDHLDQCLANDFRSNERIHNSAARTLTALRAALTWIVPRAISATNCVDYLCKALATGDVALQTAAVEALQAIYNRSGLDDDDFVNIVCPMFSPETIRLLRSVYNSSMVDVNDLDEGKYLLCKKLSELLAHLGTALEQRPQHIQKERDLPSFFALLSEVMGNPSLVVSIPVLHIWTKLLRLRPITDSEVVMPLIGNLLELCSRRLVRYEALPMDSDDPTFLFLNEDIDTVPERHAFLGNYRRYCVDIVEVIVRKVPLEATYHILSQAATLFRSLYKDQTPFRKETFSKNSTPVLRVDAQITVVDAAVKGYLKWLASQEHDLQQNEQDRNTMQDTFERWCHQDILSINFEDSEIKRKIVQLLVTLATKPLRTRPSFAVTVLDFILSASSLSVNDEASYPLYSDAMKALQHTCLSEMQRLATVFPDYFLSIYDDLERKIDHVLTTQGADDRQKLGYSAFLFIILHRSSTPDQEARRARLKQMLEPVREAWQNPKFANSVSSFGSFCELIGLGRLPEYMALHQFHKVGDWSSQQLDADGQALQADILDRFQRLPIRPTKAFLAASTDKLEDGSQAYEIAAHLWADIIPSILPNILQLVRHAHAFHNLESWSFLPEELQLVIKRVLTDRFWQAGISTESKDDFFAKVSGSKTTYEGFASTVRGTVRQIRDTCYWILFGLMRFKDFFYGIADLPVPLSQALYANAHALSAHHLSVLLSMSSHLIEGCPPHLRNHFLPPVVSSLFVQLDRKISSEWDAINKRISEAGSDDNLGDEMKTESILRQLTYSAATLLHTLLDQQRIDSPHPQDGQDGHNLKDLRMSKFVMSTPTIMEPLLLFSKSALRFRDTRSCTLVIRVLRTTIPAFRGNAPVRGFMCDDVLKAAITSLHEPYFVDCQKELASLIAQIIALDRDRASAVILSLPGLSHRPEKVERALDKIVKCPSERTTRAYVLDLLASVRGVSIHELGKIEVAKPKPKSAMQEQYMTVDEQPAIVRGGSPELAGVADMFS